MNCDKCGKNHANVKYTQIINGNKKEMILCEECSRAISLKNMDLTMDFSDFLGEVLLGLEQQRTFPNLLEIKEAKCKRCNFSFEDFINTGRFGCEECYSEFEDKIDPILRSIQGSNKHIGRIGEIQSDYSTQIENEFPNLEIEQLKKKLRKVVKEENYEEAARIRDEIKKLEGDI